MGIKAIIPSPVEVGREALIVLGGLVIAALVINSIPALQSYIQSASITLKDKSGNILF